MSVPYATALPRPARASGKRAWRRPFRPMAAAAGRVQTHRPVAQVSGLRVPARFIDCTALARAVGPTPAAACSSMRASTLAKAGAGRAAHPCRHRHRPTGHPHWAAPRHRDDLPTAGKHRHAAAFQFYAPFPCADEGCAPPPDHKQRCCTWWHGLWRPGRPGAVPPVIDRPFTDAETAALQAHLRKLRARAVGGRLKRAFERSG